MIPEFIPKVIKLTDKQQVLLAWLLEDELERAECGKSEFSKDEINLLYDLRAKL